MSDASPTTDEELIDQIITLKQELRQGFDEQKQIRLYNLIDQLENNKKEKRSSFSNNN